MGVLQLLDADETTVLFDFHDPTGAANPGTVSTKLGAALDLGSIEPGVMAIRTASGSTRRLASLLLRVLRWEDARPGNRARRYQPATRKSGGRSRE
jgi:hypothetical protein